jgi:hypothetical protein
LVCYVATPHERSGQSHVRESGFKILCRVRSVGEVIDGHLGFKAARTLGDGRVFDAVSPDRARVIA